MIIGVSGTPGDGAFNGWASAGLSSKPLVKLDLDFQRLDLAAASARPPSQGLERPWSHATVDLIGLNYTDVRASLSAAEINIADTISRPRSTPNWPAVSWSPLCRSRRLWRPGPRRPDRRRHGGEPGLLCAARLTGARAAAVAQRGRSRQARRGLSRSVSKIAAFLNH